MSTIPAQNNISAPTAAPCLPTPRTLLTSLLSSVPPPPSTAFPTNPNGNPLLHAPHHIRTLLTTLHILLPTLLLPALDLLDRALLTRLTVTPHPTPVPPESPRSATTRDVAAVPPTPKPLRGADTQSGSIAAGAENAHVQERSRVYLVRSSQATRSRSHAGGERVYIVRLEAWNCNCAAFAFSAFPGAASTLRFDAGEDRQGGEAVMDCGEQDGGKGGEGWAFGGLSLDGVGGGGVPCCKHILACVLAERLEGWVGGGVKEKEVGREEMAGLACEG